MKPLLEGGAMKKELGTLKRLEPRTAWESESKDFTPWLKDNIHLLAEKLDMELEVIEIESPVGGFVVDLLAKEISSDRLVVVENELKVSDHDHLGKLLTYAAGTDASAVVWIATEFRDEHQETLDWLNTVTSNDVGFFGLELELLQIGDSLPAPNLRVVVSPSEQGRVLRKRAASVTLQELEQLAEEKGVGILYRRLIKELPRYFPSKRTTQSWISFKGSIEGSKLTILSLVPKYSGSDVGLSFHLYLGRFCDYFGVDKGEALAMFPPKLQEEMAWKDGPNKAYFKDMAEVDRLLKGLEQLEGGAKEAR